MNPCFLGLAVERCLEREAFSSRKVMTPEHIRRFCGGELYVRPRAATIFEIQFEAQVMLEIHTGLFQEVQAHLENTVPHAIF